MVTIDLDHIDHLIRIESGIAYDQPPAPGEPSFRAVSRPSCVLLSAPHGARTYRNSRNEIWHEEDEYTAGMALLLGKLCGTSVIATVMRDDAADPNYHRGCDYKQKLGELVVERSVRYVLDLHGAALHSEKLSPTQIIDLGYRGDNPEQRSMDPCHVEQLEVLLRASGNPCLVVERNRLAARGTRQSEPVTTFIHGLGSSFRVQAIQIEMKPQVRVARRFPTASLYRTCGDYEADPHCVIDLLQALADFIEYLHTTV